MGKNSDLPLVSVIIPAYNAEAFIERTLASVCAQTYSNLEIIVVDDGSSDRTVEIVKKWEKQDSRIQLINQANTGVAAARNLAIDHAKGEYIAPLDADDIWYPSKIQHQVNYMHHAGSTFGLVYTWSVFVDEDDIVIGHCNGEEQFLKIHSLEGDVLPLLIYQNFIGNASVPLFRRQALQAVGGYKYNYCEDWELTLRIAAQYQIGVVPAFLVGYRHLLGTASGNYQAMTTAYEEILSHYQNSNLSVNPKVYEWASSLFYLYLASKAYTNRQHLPTIILLTKAIHRDLWILFRMEIYVWLLICILKIICLPAKPIFMHLRQLKLLVKHFFQLNHSPFVTETNFWHFSIYQRPEPQQPSTFHQIITKKRELELFTNCQNTNYSIRIRDRMIPETR